MPDQPRLSSRRSPRGCGNGLRH